MNVRVREPEVLISEVGPRDGLQSVKATMPTAQKLRWIDALVASGLREIEVGSFVPARLLPQMADTAEVVRHALTHPGVKIEAGSAALDWPTAWRPTTWAFVPSIRHWGVWAAAPTRPALRATS